MSKVAVKAQIKSLRLSPRKVGVVAALVRGRTVEDALTILEHTPRRAAKPLAKLISSAQANAEHNNKLKSDTLVVDKLEVGFSERGKRYKPAAHGRALPYQLKHSKITVVVTGEAKPKKTEKKVDTKKADTKKSEDKKPAEKSATKKETK